MTMTDLRGRLVVAFLALAGLSARFARDLDDAGPRVGIALLVAACLLLVASGRVHSIPGPTRLAGLGVVAPSLAAFAAGFATPMFFVLLAPWAGLLGLLGFLVSYLALGRAVRRLPGRGLMV